MNSSYEACIQACYDCLQACNYCFDSCLKEEDVKMMAGCIRLDRECADVCALAIQAMQRNSPFAKDICELCAEVCEACAAECGKHDHEHCQTCAEACRKCAEACRAM